MSKCPHQDNIEYGVTVYETPQVNVVHVLCTTCSDLGTIVSTWNEDLDDYEEIAERWFGVGDE